jgi:glycosyltransferase involved in cell wall biosynthesis
MEEALVDVVVPVRNEERTLEASIRRLHAHVRALPCDVRIVIANNGSADRTGAIADALAAEPDGVLARHLAEPGRGRAVRTAWAASDAQVLARRAAAAGRGGPRDRLTAGAGRGRGARAPARGVLRLRFAFWGMQRRD